MRGFFFAYTARKTHIGIYGSSLELLDSSFSDFLRKKCEIPKTLNTPAKTLDTPAKIQL